MMVLGQYRAVMVDTWWFWVSIVWYWLIYDGTGHYRAYWSVLGGSGSVEGGTCCTWWYWVSEGQYGLIYDVTWSI